MTKQNDLTDSQKEACEKAEGWEVSITLKVIIKDAEKLLKIALKDRIGEWHFHHNEKDVLKTDYIHKINESCLLGRCEICNVDLIYGRVESGEETFRSAIAGWVESAVTMDLRKKGLDFHSSEARVEEKHVIK